MKTGQIRVSVIGSVVVLLVAVAFALFAQRRARQAERHVETLQDERSDWARARPSRTAKRPAATAMSAAAAAEPSGESGKSDGAQIRGGGGPNEIARLRVSASEAEVGDRLAVWFHRRALPESRTAALTSEIARHERALEDIASGAPGAGRERPSDAAADQMRTKRAEEAARFRSRLESLLTPDELRDYDRFEETAAQWEEVGELAQQLYDTGVPLAPAQATELASILVAASTGTDGKVARTVLNRDEMLAEAATVLSPEQLDALKTIQERRELEAEAGRLRRAAGH